MLRLYYIDGSNFKRDLKEFEVKKLNLLSKLKALHHRNGMINGIDKDGIIYGTCSQVIDFFILFAYLDDYVDKNSEHFNLYLKIRNIYLFLTSEIIKKDHLARVDKEIKEFIFKYHQIYNSNDMESIIPKIHHIDHYPNCIKIMGNPRLYQTQNTNANIKKLRDQNLIHFNSKIKAIRLQNGKF